MHTLLFFANRAGENQKQIVALEGLDALFQGLHHHIDIPEVCENAFLAFSQLCNNNGESS